MTHWRNRLKRKLTNPKAYTRRQMRAIQEQVRARDNGRCVVCGRSDAQVHEIKQRSSDVPFAVSVFQPRFMACVCPTLHHTVHSTRHKHQANLRILAVLKKRFEYSYSSRLDAILTGYIRDGMPDKLIFCDNI